MTAESLVGVGDREHANEAASHAAVEERGAERLGVRFADVETDYLAAPGLVRGVGDHKALAYNLRAVADLLDVRVEPQIAAAVLERSRPPEGLDLL